MPLVTDQPRPPAKRSSSAPTTIRVGERRYTEEELAVILNRAIERQDGVQASAPRYSLAEIQEIAAGAGIAPDHVASVALSLRDQPAQLGGGILGAPWRLRFDESIEGELSDDAVAELVDIARRELGEQGEVVQALDAVEWKGKDTWGSTHVTVTRRRGRTSISVLSTRADAVAAAGTAGTVATVFGSMAVGGALSEVAGLSGPIAMLAAIALVTSSAWLALRVTWRRYSGWSAEGVDALGSELIEAARGAVADGHVSGSPHPTDGDAPLT